MPKQPVAGADEGAERKKEEPRQLATAIGRSVMTSLGRPEDFSKIVVVRLWENYYRVNVLTGDDPTSLRIAHSFFVSADGHGNVLESTPAVAKHYT